MFKGEEIVTKENIHNREEEFKELYEKSMREIEEGDVLKGKILSISQDYAIIDIGYKSEGQVPIKEFIDESGNISASVGDEVDVFLEKKEGKEGFVILSKAKADQIKTWDAINNAHERNETVEGKILYRIKGGFIVDIKGINAFLPGSQVDIKPVTDYDALIGKTFKFKVLKVNRRKSNIVLSRRVFLEEERGKAREETLKILEEGIILEGTVKNITDYGVFVDLGGIDGLLHITDISWGRMVHPSQTFSIGDKITVKVLRYDKEEGKISLGYKHLRPDPWFDIDKRYPAGTRARGKVVKITDYGVFVELEEGVEGLVHISEMSWSKRLKHPSQKVSIGDEVDVVVLSLDRDAKKLSLGMRQLEPNPWDLVSERYAKGSKVKGKVTNITNFGIFVEVEEGIDGLVNLSDLSWDKDVEHPSKLFKIGQEVEAVVLNIDKESERFSLGIKQLERDPWRDIDKKYRPGMTLKGRVTNIAEFGVFVELEEGIEGLIHISEFGRGKGKERLPEPGEEVDVEILNLDPEDRKIGLSIKR